MSFLAQAHAEYPWQVGRGCPDRAWILSPFDVWQANPHYRGPAVPHPEDAFEGYDDLPFYDPTVCYEAEWAQLAAQADREGGSK